MYLQRTSWNLCSRLVTASLLVTWQSSLVSHTSLRRLLSCPAPGCRWPENCFC